MKNSISKSIIFIIDLALLIMIFYLVSFLRSYFESSYLPTFETIHLSEYLFAIFIILVLFTYEGIYTYRYDFWQETRKIFQALGIGFFIILSLLTLTKTNYDYSRIFIVIYFFASFLLLPITKRYTKKILYSFKYFKNTILVVGSEEQTQRFKNEFEKNWYLGQEFSTQNYESVIIASEDIDVKEINRLIIFYLNQKKKLSVVPYITEINFSNSKVQEYSNIRLNAIEVENKLLIKHNILLKNIAEKLLTLLLLPFFLILHILISFAIKRDSKGDVLFKQTRLGKDGTYFTCYKYRTMYEDSDTILEKYLQENPQEVSCYDTYHKYKNDPRITKVGRFLRETSLDELTQILNVLNGTMNLVGPRPYMLKEEIKLGEYKEIILKVKPGITGLWQVSGRNDLSFKERNELEIWYIKNWSLWADFIIFLKTIKTVLYKVGAK